MTLDETSAKRGSAASTAEGAALVRAAGATEPDEKVRNPDYMAAGFVGGGLRLPALVKVPGLRRLVPRIIERMMPGLYYFETARTLHIDAVVRAEMGEGVAQLVILGAGYDSRAYRMTDDLGRARVYEVDHPAMSAIKRDKVRSLVGDPPANLAYVEIDFTRDELGELLAAHGHDRDQPTLYVWSGVAPYLPEDAVRKVLAFVGSHPSPATSILFDYCYRELIEGDDSYHGAPELLAQVSKVGEPLRSGIPRGKTEEYLAELGLRVESDLGPDDAMERYLRRTDGSVHGRPLGGGGFAHARAAAG